MTDNIIQNTENIKKDTQEYLEILNNINIITYELFLTNTIQELNPSLKTKDNNEKAKQILSHFNHYFFEKNMISANKLLSIIESKIHQFSQFKKVAEFSFLNSKSISMLHYKNLKHDLVSFKKMPDETFSTYYSIIWNNLRISFWDHENTNYHYYDPIKFNFSNSIIRIDENDLFKHNEYWFNNTIQNEEKSSTENVENLKDDENNKRKNIYWSISKTAYSNNEISISASKALKNKNNIVGVLSVNIELLNLIYEYSLKINDQMHIFIFNKQTNNIVLYSPKNIQLSNIESISFFDKIQIKKEIYNLLKEEVEKDKLSKSYNMKSIFNIENDFYRETFLLFYKNLQEANLDINAIKQYPFNFSYQDQDYLGVISTFDKNFNLNWILGIIYNKEDLYKEIKAKTYILIYFSTFIVILGFLLGLYISSGISSTLETLAKRTKLIGSLKLNNNKYSVNSIIYEFKLLNNAFNNMTLSLRSFKKYIPAEVVRFLLLKSKEATLGGNREILTIYFSDIADFTSISEKLTPEKLVELLSDYLEKANQIIQKNEGTVDKYIGDAVVSFWGAPKKMINHAFLACKSAIEVQKGIDVLNNEEKFKKENIFFNTRIGIHTGEVIVGNIGSKSRINYTVIGDTVNLASRLEGLNKYYKTKIICSESTHNQIKHVILTRKLDYVAVKGKNVGITIYEVINFYEYINSDYLHFISIYEKAFNLYLNKQFYSAITILKIGEKVIQDDYPSEILMNRCYEYLSQPPDDNWNGIYIFKNK